MFCPERAICSLKLSVMFGVSEDTEEPDGGTDESTRRFLKPASEGYKSYDDY